MSLYLNLVSIILGPLAVWGRPTMTNPPIQGRPLIDGAPVVILIGRRFDRHRPNRILPLEVDQRGFPRSG